MYYILKNFLLIILAFLAPIWFPLTQKVFRNELLSYGEWLVLLLILIIPLSIMWWGERNDNKRKNNELKEALNDAVKTGIRDYRQEKYQKDHSKIHGVKG